MAHLFMTDFSVSDWIFGTGPGPQADKSPAGGLGASIVSPDAMAIKVSKTCQAVRGLPNSDFCMLMSLNATTSRVVPANA